jgi:hypothetical protein
MRTEVFERDDDKRLIEVPFPLKQASLASVDEKNVPHPHIWTLHISPALRPLAGLRHSPQPRAAGLRGV